MIGRKANAFQMQAAAEWVCSQMRHTVGNRYAGKRIAAIECKIADAEQMVGQRQVGKVSAAGKSMISDAGYRLGNDQTGKNSAFRERIVADAAKTVRRWKSSDGKERSTARADTGSRSVSFRLC